MTVLVKMCVLKPQGLGSLLEPELLARGMVRLPQDTPNYSLDSLVEGRNTTCSRRQNGSWMKESCLTSPFRSLEKIEGG